ncbi:uncharacterized protein NECHADRAFT_50042 [Fusarium vanettenii 77-13-4]|uniref:Inner kinetochore subunit AME1 domain-containing protein n=1 Tax=Fusarium vanettenii (strain ATCC MYA-4622 / CBS 123669 / FGSC 9596 / NRRL 45880 / 77-13-4) TaxID=660122 RepID=C7ZNW7_FUSV7|nr:uncharacterized protein NECHADRAFT_50042 [Fusarium vanettenii 77-13-4]EEU34074.1 hypothetical protein NECHADRAFT_50042 [Fusarium vanettenii 77-13-4]
MATGKPALSCQTLTCTVSNNELGQQRRADRLNERLRGAQRAVIEDDSFNLDIAGLNIAGSTPAAPSAPAPPAPSARRTPNTSAKRKRLENDIPPSAQPPGSARRRSPRSAPRDPYDLPDSSKESAAQVTTAEATEVEEEEPSVENVEATEPQIPSPTEEPQDNEPDVALPVLPNDNASGSPAIPPSREGAQEGAHSPPDRRRNVRMSDALSSTTRLHDGLYTEEEVPPSSSPLVRKVRRSEGAASIRARMRRQSSRAAEKEDVDELSPDRPTDYNPADDELSDTNPVEEEPEVEAEVEAPEAEETEEEPVAEDEVPEETEIREEEEAPEDAVAEEIDEVEAAKAIGRKRLRRSLPSRSPEVELSDVVEEEAEEEEPAPKRRRGRPSRSPATQKQPATKPKTGTRSRARDSEPKTKAKRAARKTKQATKDRRISDGTAIELTVQRWVNAKQFRQGDGKEDPIASEVPFQNQEETVVDVFAQVCLEVVETTLAKLYETMTSTEDKEKKKECRIKIRAVDAYREQLTLQLLQLTTHLNDWHSLRKRVRLIQREKLKLREDILQLKAEREQVALRMDAVRIKHEEDTKESKYRLDTSAIMHDVDLAVEQGRDAPELSRAQEKKAELANLELLVARITNEASSASSAGGMLQQVKEFNAFLERAAVALETR